MPSKKPNEMTFTERLKAGLVGEKRKRYHEHDNSPAESVDLYAAHARLVTKRAKLAQEPVGENTSVWEAIEQRRSEEGQLPLDKRGR